MRYRAVRNRVAVDLHSLNLPISIDDARVILQSLGFTFHPIQIFQDLRRVKDSVVYVSRAHTKEAPRHADCSSLLKWAFGESGIYIPRLSIQQRDDMRTIDREHIRAYDLVFMNGRKHGYHRPDTDPAMKVGHVGVVTHADTVIHMTRNGLMEESFDELFEDRRSFRGAARVIDNVLSTQVLEIPAAHEVESSDCILWLILSKLPMLISLAPTGSDGM